MHWIITKDLINTSPDDTPKVGRFCGAKQYAEALRAAPKDAKEAIRQAFRDTMNFEFRLYDDDNELYYEGLCKDLDDADEEQAFAPLDWAMADVGATRMDYRKKGDTEWQTL